MSHSHLTKLMASSDQTAKIIDGKAIAQTIRSEIAEEVRDLSEKHGKVRDHPNPQFSFIVLGTV